MPKSPCLQQNDSSGRQSMTYVYEKPSSGEVATELTAGELLLLLLAASGSPLPSNFCSRRLFARRFENQICRHSTTQQESPAVADKPARRLRKVRTVYVRAVGL